MNSAIDKHIERLNYNWRFIMIKKAASLIDEHEPTLETAALPVTEHETVELPVTEIKAVELSITESKTLELPVTDAKVGAPSDEADKDCQDVKILELKIAELDYKFAVLQSELDTLLNNKNKKKRGSKEGKVKCKCKGKKVAKAKCKCKSKKVAK